jgi:hypothetical protein
MTKSLRDRSQVCQDVIVPRCLGKNGIQKIEATPVESPKDVMLTRDRGDNLFNRDPRK